MIDMEIKIPNPVPELLDQKYTRPVVCSVYFNINNSSKWTSNINLTLKKCMDGYGSLLMLLK